MGPGRSPSPNSAGTIRKGCGRMADAVRDDVVETPKVAPGESDRSSSSRLLQVFSISFLLLFFELACIRWFPAHVQHLTHYANTVLLASFLGMSLGCLVASHRRDYLVATPYLLFATMVCAYVIGLPESPFFSQIGVVSWVSDPVYHKYVIVTTCSVFYVSVALLFVGPGQILGRLLLTVPDRITAYTANIVGSLVGILLFSLCSKLELGPFWWFLIIAVGLDLFLVRQSRPLASSRFALYACLGISVLTMGEYVDKVRLDNNDKVRADHIWSPYFRIDYQRPPVRRIAANLIGFQAMSSRDSLFSRDHAYPLPYLLTRDASELLGERPPKIDSVLVIGAGSGNDVSRALQWGASRVDAVEIDPVIVRLGKKDHPDHPYDDPRVHVFLDDGRNFLRNASPGSYDLVVFALVDSALLQSSYSSLLLESYLFTDQAFSDVRRCLRPNGLFAVYNFFRNGWLIARIQKSLKRLFGGDPPVLTNPPLEKIDPDGRYFHHTLVLAGNTEPLNRAFRKSSYWLRCDVPVGPGHKNGFLEKPSSNRAFTQLLPAVLLEPAQQIESATDDWPFPYLRRPTMPPLNLALISIYAIITVALLILARRGLLSDLRRVFPARMFFLGAGFMLIETRAVVHMALLFGNTWTVNAIVFASVLVMILIANLIALRSDASRIRRYYTALSLALGLNLLIPLDAFLGLTPSAQILLVCPLTFLPILFAGIIFALSFARTNQPEIAFSTNIGGGHTRRSRGESLGLGRLSEPHLDRCRLLRALVARRLNRRVADGRDPR